MEAYWSRIESYSRLRESYVSLQSASFPFVSLRFTSFLHVSVSFLLSFLSSFLHVTLTIEQRKRPSLKTLCRAPSGALTIPTFGSSV